MFKFSRSALLCASSLTFIMIATPALADPIAGPRPQTIPGSQACAVQGQVVVTGIGNPVVADGFRSGDGLWSIFGIQSGVNPTCSFPTAAPASVECRVNGRPADPTNCAADDYAALTGQDLVPISPGGSPPSDLRYADWVRPGFETRGCSADWNAVDGAAPPACGATTVPVTVTCEATNSQSGTIPAEYLTCDPATRPADSKTVTNFESCSISMETGSWSQYSNNCGPVTRTRTATCRRSDGTALSLDSTECSGLVSTFVSGLPASQSVTSQNATQLTVTENAELQPCSDPSANNVSWVTSAYGSPSANCGPATQTRTVECRQDADGVVVSDDFCEIAEGPKPATTQSTYQTSGCSGPNFCSGGSLIQTYNDNTAVDRKSACSASQGSCLETSLQHSSSQGSPSSNYQSRCFSNSSPATKPSGEGSFVIGGVTYTFGYDGWCDYQTNGSDRNCLIDAVSVTPSTVESCYGDEVLLTAENVMQDCQQYADVVGYCSNGTSNGTPGGSPGNECVTRVSSVSGDNCAVYGRVSTTQSCDSDPVDPQPSAFCMTESGPRSHSMQNPVALPAQHFDASDDGGVCSDVSKADCLNETTAQQSYASDYFNYGYARITVVYDNAYRVLDSGMLNGPRAFTRSRADGGTGICIPRFGGGDVPCSDPSVQRSSVVSMTLGGVNFSLNSSIDGNFATTSTLTKSAAIPVCEPEDLQGLDKVCTDVFGSQFCTDKIYYADTDQCLRSNSIEPQTCDPDQ